MERHNETVSIALSFICQTLLHSYWRIPDKKAVIASKESELFNKYGISINCHESEKLIMVHSSYSWIINHSAVVIVLSDWCSARLVRPCSVIISSVPVEINI